MLALLVWVFLFSALVCWKLYRKRARCIAGLAVAGTWTPWFGSLFYFWPYLRQERVLHALARIFKEQDQSNVCVGVPLCAPTMLTIDPKTVEHILKTSFTNYGKGPVFHDMFEELLGNGIFNTDGEIWYAQRKLAAQIFTSRQLRDRMRHVFLLHAQEDVLAKLEEAASTQAYIDVQKLFLDYTFHSICDIAFSLTSMDEDQVKAFGVAFDRMSTLCQKRFVNPFWKSIRKVCRLVNGITNRLANRLLKHVGEMEMIKLQKVVNDFAYKIVHHANGPQSSDDLLSLFRKQENAAFTDAYLKDLILNFIIAGRDSTAQTLAWLTFLLFRDESIDGCTDLVRPNLENQTRIQETLYKEMDGELSHDPCLALTCRPLFTRRCACFLLFRKTPSSLGATTIFRISI